MIHGYIEVWLEAKKYGFIHGTDGGELVKYFLHHTNIVSGHPRTGAAVAFNVGRNSKGLVALDVEVLAGGSR
jgi:cold shock CspA family protein